MSTGYVPRAGTKRRIVYDLTIRPRGATKSELNRATKQKAWSFVTDTRTIARLLGGTAHASPEGDGDARRFWITVP
jgi:hypothetical protein